MPDKPSKPAQRADFVQALSHALRYSLNGKRSSQRDNLTADLAAEHLADALTRSGFTVMQGPPAPDHAANYVLPGKHGSEGPG